jgi:integrase
VGSVIEFPKRKDAEKAISQLSVDINEGAAFAPMNVEQLASHYEKAELPRKAHSTSEEYKNYLHLHILPKWEKYSLATIKPMEVENWLRTIKKAIETGRTDCSPLARHRL